MVLSTCGGGMYRARSAQYQHRPGERPAPWVEGPIRPSRRGRLRGADHVPASRPLAREPRSGRSRLVLGSCRRSARVSCETGADSVAVTMSIIELVSIGPSGGSPSRARRASAPLTYRTAEKRRYVRAASAGRTASTADRHRSMLSGVEASGRACRGWRSRRTTSAWIWRYSGPPSSDAARARPAQTAQADARARDPPRRRARDRRGPGALGPRDLPAHLSPGLQRADRRPRRRRDRRPAPRPRRQRAARRRCQRAAGDHPCEHQRPGHHDR